MDNNNKSMTGGAGGPAASSQSSSSTSNLLSNEKQTQLANLLDAYIESKIFLNDPYIKNLVDKSITLGMAWDNIKETFKRFLLQYLTKTTCVSFENLDFKLFIDENKFFDHLVVISIQNENINNSNNSNNNQQQQNSNLSINKLISMGPNQIGSQYLWSNSDYNPDDLLNDNEQIDVYQNDELDLDMNEYPIINTKLSQMNIGNKVIQQQQQQQQLQHHLSKLGKVTTQPQQQQQQQQAENKPKQQSFQEYLAQSMNRINDKSNLRPIIVDGSDVALSTNKQVFTLNRIKQVVDFFEKRNHQIYVILPQWRKEQIMSATSLQPNQQQTNSIISSNSSSSSQSAQSSTTAQNSQSTQSSSSSSQGSLNSDQSILLEMEQKNQVHYSPSKRVGGKRIVCDDDSYILNLAVTKNGIIVSNDNFKRFLNQRDEFKLVIEERVLMYSFIDETFMPAEDPLGKNGPSLDNFLRFESFTNQQYMKRCPYKKKCTYGSKCKFWHPERGLNQSGQQFKTAHQSVLDQAQEQRMRLEIILNQHNDYDTTSPLILNTNPLLNSVQSSSSKNTKTSANISPSNSRDNLLITKTNQNTQIMMNTFTTTNKQFLDEHPLKRMGPDSSQVKTSFHTNKPLITNQTSLNDWSTNRNINSEGLTSFNLFPNSTLNQSDSNINLRFIPNHQYSSFTQQQQQQQSQQLLTQSSLTGEPSQLKTNPDQLLIKQVHQTSIKNPIKEPSLSSSSSSNSSSNTSLSNKNIEPSSSSSIISNQTTITNASSSSPTSSSLNIRAKLKPILKDDNLIEQFLAKNKDITDEEKLIFYANESSFDF